MVQPQAFVTKISATLEAAGDTKTKESSHRYFKEPIVVHGVKSAKVSEIARTFFEEVKVMTKDEALAVCEALYKTGYCEEAFIAASWSHKFHTSFIESDFQTFERWVDRYIDNWAKCDTLCNHTIGTFVEMYPTFVKNIKTWTSSKNRWKKRAAAVTFILPARHGKFLQDVFDIATTLLTDPDDMVQKGYGWALKAASQSHQQKVFDFVMKHKSNMPRTALRYAIEKMPDALRKKAMEK